MSPILTRPIREQLEHDRIIRQLQPRYKRRHDVVINPGPEHNESVMVGDLAVYPDLVLFSTSRGRKLEGTVEVETAESVNALEALAEWGVFSRLKVPFHLYVPPQSLDTARRLCEEHGFNVAEIWTYHLGLDQVRFTQVYRAPAQAMPKASPAPGSASPAARRKPAARPKAAAAAARKPAKAAARARTKPSAPAKTAKARKSSANGKKTAGSARPRAKTAAKVKRASARKRR